MGNWFSIAEDYTRDELVNEFFETDDGSILSIAPPLVMDDIITDSEKNQCKICNANLALFTVFPCEHKCICNGCLTEIYERQAISFCPYPNCNKKINKIL